jgi:hypothetical protein
MTKKKTNQTNKQKKNPPKQNKTNKQTNKLENLQYKLFINEALTKRRAIMFSRLHRYKCNGLIVYEGSLCEKIRLWVQKPLSEMKKM